MRVTCLIAALVLCCKCSALQPQSSGLHLTSVTDKYISGTFTDYSNGNGIRFICAPESIFIATLDNRIIVDIGKEVYSDETESDRIINVEGWTFLHHKGSSGKKDIRITTGDAYKISSAADDTEKLSAIKDVMDQAEKQDMNTHKESVHSSLETFLDDPHTKLIVEAATIMGKVEGLYGSQYPILLPFYATALRLDEATNGQNTSLNMQQLEEEEEENEDREKRYTCDSYSTCPPCQNNECLGMCGPGCWWCWSWICGDCCYYTGCYYHDVCCGEEYWSWSCIIPFGFSCHGYYYCY